MHGNAFTPTGPHSDSPSVFWPWKSRLSRVRRGQTIQSLDPERL